jgi:hypothetical protein
MLAEFGVFAGHHGMHEMRRDRVERPPGFADRIALDQPDEHERGHRRRHLAIDRDEQQRRDHEPADGEQQDATKAADHAPVSTGGGR